MNGRNRRLGAWLGLVWAAALTLSVRGEVKVEKVAYFNQPNCYKLSNGTVEVIVTTDIGPRVIRYGFTNQENILGELPAESNSDPNAWKAYGGHRLWTAPEAMPRSYSPDNRPVEYKIEGNRTIRLIQSVEPTTGIQKEIAVTLDADGTGVTLHHKLTNRNLWGIEVAPWALTIMNGGGTTILPQEPYRSHDDYLLPARPLVLWHYTDLSDPRWTIGKKFLRLRTDSAIKEPQKVGMANKQGWSAYHRKGTLFIKRFNYKEGVAYPDYGSNNETYTSASFMEVETLAPLSHLEPGASAEHTERWYLFRHVDLGATDDRLDAVLRPLLAQAPAR